MSSTTQAIPRSRTVTLSESEQAAVREIMRTKGIRRAHAMLGIGRHPMERAAGGLTVQRGTVAMIKLALKLVNGAP